MLYFQRQEQKNTIVQSNIITSFSSLAQTNSPSSVLFSLSSSSLSSTTLCNPNYIDCLGRKKSGKDNSRGKNKSGKSTSRVKINRGKIWSGKILVTRQIFGHFSQIFFSPDKLFMKIGTSDLPT